MESKKLMRITTVPISLHLLLKGQFRFMKDQGFQVFTVSADGKEIQEVIKEGVEHITVPMTRKITPVQDLIALVKLVSVMRNIRPDIVHTHTPKAGLLGMLAAYICRVPIRLHTVAGLPLMEAVGLKRKLLIWIEHITCRCATKVYVNAKGLLNFMVRDLKLPTDKLGIIGEGSSNGIDSHYFSRTAEMDVEGMSIRRKYGIADNAVVFLFIGRIVKDKGIIELTDAFKRMEGHKDRTCHLILVGPTEQDLDPIPQATDRYLQNNQSIVLAGFQRDVRTWLAAADIFVFPSYREGFPNVVLQACCMGVPCIVTDINGCNEIIDHGRTGLIVPPKDSAALYNAMLMMSNDLKKSKSQAALARKYVVANFDQHTIWTLLQSAYQHHLVSKHVI